PRIVNMNDIDIVLLDQLPNFTHDLRIPDRPSGQSDRSIVRDAVVVLRIANYTVPVLFEQTSFIKEDLVFTTCMAIMVMGNEHVIHAILVVPQCQISAVRDVKIRPCSRRSRRCVRRLYRPTAREFRPFWRRLRARGLPRTEATT